tara:strand:+ start:688 stop:1461 length:774 start_codon:yes stop_codon:yes gene_type:complete
MSTGVLVFNESGATLFDSRAPSLIAFKRHIIPYHEDYSNLYSYRDLNNSNTYNYYSHYWYYPYKPRNSRHSEPNELNPTAMHFVKVPVGGVVVARPVDFYGINTMMIQTSASSGENIEIVECDVSAPIGLPVNPVGAISYDEAGNVTWHSEAPVVALADVISGQGLVTVAADAEWLLLPKIYWTDPNVSNSFTFPKDRPVGLYRASATEVRMVSLDAGTSKHGTSALWPANPPYSMTARIDTSLIPTELWPVSHLPS